MKNVLLPNVPSELLRIAVADAQKCEADPKYLLKMSVWHEKRETGACRVCMAGAIMAQTLGSDPRVERSLEPDDFDGNDHALVAVNHLRCGDIDYAVDELNIDLSEEQSAAEAAIQEKWSERYKALSKLMGDSVHLPWSDYLQLADELEAVGL